MVSDFHHVLTTVPLKWEEFCLFLRQACFVSATPGDWEMNISSNVAELIVRPTGVVDPEVIVVPATGTDRRPYGKAQERSLQGERALVTTLTKRSSEDLSEYLSEIGFKVKYIHSELDAFERTELIRDLRKGDISVLVGVNLLREGIDLPEVSFVGIVDADREGFLRSRRSLIQIIGRAARNTSGRSYFMLTRRQEHQVCPGRNLKEKAKADQLQPGTRHNPSNDPEEGFLPSSRKTYGRPC